jgi:tetratricopeptide (TPR) repeat protein
LAARAATFAAAGSYSEAEVDFTAALALAPLDAHGYVGRTAARRKLNALAKGLDDANRALLIDGSLVAAYTVRADIHEALGQLDNARTAGCADHKALGRLV